MLPTLVISKLASHLSDEVDTLFKTCRAYHSIRHDHVALCEWALKTYDPVAKLYTSQYFTQELDTKTQKQCVQFLLEHGAHPTPAGLREAIIRHHDDVIKALIARGAVFRDGAALAAMYGHVDLVKFFLDRGDDPHKTVIEAVKYEELSIVEFLMKEYHIFPDAVVKMAIIFDHINVVSFIEQRFPIRDISESMRTAIEFNRPKIVQNFMKRCPITVDMVRLAAMYGHHLVLDAIFSHDKDFACDLEALRLSIMMNYVHAVGVFLKNGANPNHAIVMAMEQGSVDVVHAIFPSVDISHALTSAISSNRPEFVQKFLELGADPQDGMLLAVICDNLEAVKLLLQYGACPDGAIRKATQFGVPSMVTYLAKYARASLKDGLWGAIQGGRACMVRLLVELGADMHDSEIVQWVSRYGNEDIVQVFHEKLNLCI